MKRLKRYLITGLVIISPVFLTFYVIVLIFQFADGILGKFINEHVKHNIGFYLPGLGFLLSLGIVLLVGFLANLILFKKLLPKIEKILLSIPLIRNLYPAFKQLITFVLGQHEFKFEKVVLVEYPSKGIWSIGFLTNETYKKINETINNKMVAVFVPNTPGPLAGYVIFIPRNELKFLDIPVSDALKIIISGGVINI